MSYRADELAAQTAIRHRMLGNGYSPVPNYDKRCFMVGRNDNVIDAAMVDLWSTQMKNLSTGVRVEGSLVAIDIDIDDVDAIDAFTRALPDNLWDRLRLAPVRCSSARTKVAWFVRLADGETPFSRLTSASFYHPDDPAGEDGTTHRVEIFGGSSGQQMGVFGAHTRDDSDVTVVHKEYLWGDTSLLDVPLCDLPALTRAELALVADTASRVLIDTGWPRKRYSKSGFSSPQVIYDITDDTVFETLDGQLSLPELMDEAIGVSGVRISASFHSPGSHNVTRCIASLGHDNKLRIIDFETANTHRHASDAPKPIRQGMLDRLRQLSSGGTFFERVVDNALPDEGPVAKVGVPVGADMGVVLDSLLAEFAYCAVEQRPVLPIGGGGGMTLAAFRTLMLPYAVEVTGPRGGTRTINPVSMWECDALRVDVAGSRYRPDVADRLCVVDGEVFINTYRPPEAGDAGDRAASAVEAFEALLSHLLVREDERAWFRMWVAAKAQRPWVAGCGVLMVAEEQGTGRGTLINMLSAVYGARNVKPVTSIELMGGSGQGQYNGWQADSVLVTCDEVMAGDDGGGAMTWKRREAYEKLKQLVDPQRRAVTIRRKHIEAYDTEVFASFLLATNHTNALPLAHNDRRFAVLMQEDIKFDDRPGLAEAVNVWRPNGRFGPDFGAAVRSWLMGVAVDWDAIRRAPDMGEGRAIMQEQNEGDLANLLRDVLSRVPGDYVTNKDLGRRMQIALQAEVGGVDGHKNWWVRAQDMLRGINSMKWRKMPTRQNLTGADGKPKTVTVYHREADGVLQAWLDTPLADRWEKCLSAASDVNRSLSAIEQAARDGRLRPLP